MTTRQPPIDPLRRRVIGHVKITGFLLSPDHPKGKYRERYLTRFGFRRDDPQILANALLEHVATGEVTGITTDARGWLYEVTGPLRTPDGRNPSFVTIWIVRHIGPAEFVTGYPA